MLKTLSKLFEIVAFFGLLIFCVYILFKDTVTLKEVADLAAITLIIVLNNQTKLERLEEMQEKIR